MGQFYLNYPSLKVVVDLEGRELKPRETWQLESFTFQPGNDREQLLEIFMPAPSMRQVECFFRAMI